MEFNSRLRYFQSPCPSSEVRGEQGELDDSRCWVWVAVGLLPGRLGAYSHHLHLGGLLLEKKDFSRTT